ncbi:MAG: hypothetical protein AAGU14_02610 [Eubacteriaceae bacterium]
MKTENIIDTSNYFLPSLVKKIDIIHKSFTNINDLILEIKDKDNLKDIELVKNKIFEQIDEILQHKEFLEKSRVDILNIENLDI